MARHKSLANRETEALEIGCVTQNLCMPVRPLHFPSTLVLAKCAQRRLEHRKPPATLELATPETEASDLCTAWTLGPAAAQVAPRGFPLEPEASEHHWPLGNQELEDAELRLELEDLEPEGIGVELLDNGQGALEDPRP